jgi:low density lipoprotein receptor-related protein 5/6
LFCFLPANFGRNCFIKSIQLLLLAKRFEIIQISLDTPDFTETVIPFDLNLDFAPVEFSSVAIDYDPVDKFVYWSDQLHGIFRSLLNGSSVEHIVAEDISHPDGVAVDWIGRNIFWYPFYKTIFLPYDFSDKFSSCCGQITNQMQ